MKFFRNFLIALALAAAFALPCRAQEVFHAAYLHGFPDGTIRPEQAVTRAELAEILYRMLPPDTRVQTGDSESAFQDVPPSHWAYSAISAMARLRLMLGGPDGKFRPDDGVTGQELSIILERIRSSDAGKEALPELSKSWQAERITFADGNGWVMGLHDGIFSKGRSFTRAELAQLLNRLLGRTPADLSDLLIGMPLFSDNLDTSTPYFFAMQEAAIDHTASCAGAHESWTGLG